MLKLLIITAFACVLCRMFTGRWPWQLAAIGGTDVDPGRAARRLLGVGRKASRPQILRAHKTLIARVHPDRGGSDAQVHEADAARDLLLARLPDATRRKDPS